MLTRMRNLTLPSMLALCLGTGWSQSQTNITVEDGSQPAPKTQDTVQVAPPGTHVVPNGNGGSAVVDDQDYTPPDTAREVGAIPASQTKTLQNRKESKRFSGAGFGPAGFGNIDERMPAYDIYAGRFWEVNKHAAIKALGEVASDLDHATLANLQLGANLYAMPTDISPYVGAGMGLGYGTVPGDRSFGFNLGASVGALLFRTSNAQMNLEGNAQTMLSELGNNGDMPTVYSARLGVLF
jgi:hypothetical protein